MAAKMKSLSLRCLAFAVIFSALELSNVQGCTVNQYTKVFTSGASICVDCPRCPAGYGLQPQCGTSIAADTKIWCQPCMKGVNYSMNNDHEQCLPCGSCSYDQVTTPCTPESKTICHPKCKSKGNYFEESSGDCQKCSWCCDNGNDVVKDECINKSIPRHQSCTVHRKKKCTPVPVAVITKTAFRPTNSSKLKSSTSISTIYSVSTTSNLSDPTHTPSGPDDSKNEKKGSKTEITIYLAIVIPVAFVFIFLMVYFVKKCCCNKRRNHRCYTCTCNPTFRCRCHPLQPRGSQQDGLQAPFIQPAVVCIDESHPQPLPVVQDPANHVIIGADIRLFDWFNEGNNWRVKNKICVMLDTDESFVKVAHHFGMDDYEIKNIKQRSSNPTEDVLDKLQSSKPALLISEFIECIDHDDINRRDVSEVLKKAL